MKAEISMTASDFAALCGGRLEAGTGRSMLTCLSSDSRELGNGSIFAALKGERFDGHDFVSDIIQKKSAQAVLVSEAGFEKEAERNGIDLILCGDVVRALETAAGNFRRTMNPQVFAVTGTNGKTTTKELLSAVLAGSFRTHKNEKNFNNEIGVPFAVFGLRPEHEKAVFELGMNHPGEITRLSGTVKPSVAAVTSVGEGHLEFLGSVENVARAKMEILSGMEPGSAVLLNRDTMCFDMQKETAVKAGMKVISFGLGPDADVHPDSWKLAPDFLEAVYSGVTVRVPLYGIHNVSNLTAAVAAAGLAGLDPEHVKASLENFSLIGGRSQIFDRGYTVINDTYNSNPLSARSAFLSMKEIFPDRRKIAALSDMKELGDAAPACHRETGKKAAEAGVDLLCLWSSFSEEYAAGAEEGGMKPDMIKRFSSKEEMSMFLKGFLKDGDVVLVKGSRSMKMEEVVYSLIK